MIVVRVPARQATLMSHTHTYTLSKMFRTAFLSVMLCQGGGGAQGCPPHTRHGVNPFSHNDTSVP